MLAFGNSNLFLGWLIFFQLFFEQEGHILQYKYKFELVKITESQLIEVLNDNKTLTLSNNDLMM